MIRETSETNNGNIKSMLSRFSKRVKKSNNQKRSRAIMYRTAKKTALRRKRKALMRLAWEYQQYLKSKTAKL